MSLLFNTHPGKIAMLIDSDRAESQPGTFHPVSEMPKKTFEIDVATVRMLGFWLKTSMQIMVLALFVQYASFFITNTEWLGSEKKTIEGLSRINILGTMIVALSFFPALFIVTQLPRELGCSLKSTLGYTIVSLCMISTSREHPADFHFSLPLGMVLVCFWLLMAVSSALKDHERKQEEISERSYF